jgi:hypothetical protein
MKYMLMMNVPSGAAKYQINDWAPEDFRNHMAFMHRYNKDLKAAGEFVDVQGLSAPGQAKLVRAASDGTPITDGPFAETKEFLAGYWIVEVENEARAIALAAKASAAPGPGGAPLNMAIEVRAVLTGLPTD